MYDWQLFIEPVNTGMLHNDEGYLNGQVGTKIKVNDGSFPDIDDCDIILLGCNEFRGEGSELYINAADAVRRQFYRLFSWHHDINIADLGNIRSGATLNDSYAAVRTVLRDLLEMKKTVLILGGSHDLTLAQYNAYGSLNKIIEAAAVDSLINLSIENPLRSENFLMEMLTGEPNFMRHYNHIGFQSYYVHPHMLETMDKLRFDCYRLGLVKEKMEDMEPVIRNCELFSFDIAAIAHAYAPANHISANGFSGEEACMLMQYAGMSPISSSIGIYGYNPVKDENELTAKQIAQMIWYFIDGRFKGKHEARMEEKDSFNQFHTAFAEVDTVFIQSKKTGRWWMQLPDKRFIACAHSDYVQASHNEIPERWLRAQERN
jgi:arginase family enzyme